LKKNVVEKHKVSSAEGCQESGLSGPVMGGYQTGRKREPTGIFSWYVVHLGNFDTCLWNKWYNFENYISTNKIFPKIPDFPCQKIFLWKKLGEFFNIFESYISSVEATYGKPWILRTLTFSNSRRFLTVCSFKESSGSLRGGVFGPAGLFRFAVIELEPADLWLATTPRELATTKIIEYPPNSGQESGVRTLVYCCNLCVSWMFLSVFLGTFSGFLIAAFQAV
jgi:hypothetical protein